MLTKIKNNIKKIKEARSLTRYKSNIVIKKEILPKDSFSKKLLEIYSKNPGYLGNEIGLIKFNKKLYDITLSASKESFIFSNIFLRDLVKKGVNISKSTFIHTHILSKRSLRKNINPSFGDLSTFKIIINEFGMKNFQISILDDKHIEIGRTYLLFDLQKKENFNQMYNKLIENEESAIYSKIVKNGFSISLLNQLGFKVRYLPLSGYTFSEKKKQFVKG